MSTLFSSTQTNIVSMIVDDSKQPTPRGFSIDIFKNKTDILQYQCEICKNICKNPVELSCVDSVDDYNCDNDEDSLYNHDVLYCNKCLSLHLSLTNHQCPINPKHTNAHYNITRNIRKQINNLSIYCSNNTCDWEGTLSQLSTHLKICKYNNKIHCQICNKFVTEQNIIKHNANNTVHHITLLYHTYNHNNMNISITDFNSKIEEQIKDLKTNNNQLKRQINEWKIAYALEHHKHEIKSKEQSDIIKLLQKQQNELQLSIGILNNKYQKLENELQKMRENRNAKTLALQGFDSEEEAITMTPLKRTKSTRFFHPESTEKYHSGNINYAMYHPKKSKVVWVSKAVGQMSKLHRFPCCGSAKSGNLYLTLGTKNKCNNGECVYVVGDNNKLPKNWNDKMYLGCKKNKKRNTKNKSYYECCNGNIMSVGCKERYICCKEDYDANKEDNGCKTGWGC